MQDVSGGKPVVVEGTDGMLWGMEVDVEAAKAELREIAKKDEGKGASKFLSSIGLGSLAEQLEDLKLGRLFQGERIERNYSGQVWHAGVGPPTLCPRG